MVSRFTFKVDDRERYPVADFGDKDYSVKDIAVIVLALYNFLIASDAFGLQSVFKFKRKCRNGMEEV